MTLDQFLNEAEKCQTIIESTVFDDVDFTEACANLDVAVPKLIEIVRAQAAALKEISMVDNDRDRIRPYWEALAAYRRTKAERAIARVAEIVSGTILFKKQELSKDKEA